MALKKIARVGDTVIGHIDVQGNAVVGVIATGNTTVKNGSQNIATTDCLITLPSHAHEVDGLGSPINFHSHSWRIIGTGKNTIGSKAIARDQDGGNNADWDGFQNQPSALQIQATTTTLYCN